MSFVHVFTKPDEPVYFCYSYPFSYSHQQMLLEDLERRRLPYVARDLLCHTVQRRRCDVLTIGGNRGEGVGVNEGGGEGGGRGGGAREHREETGAGAGADAGFASIPSPSPPPLAGAAAAVGATAAAAAGGKRKVVMLSCRVHPGETPCSHTLRGFLDFLVSDHEHAVALRAHVTFVVVPMLNPDGCYHGGERGGHREPGTRNPEP